MADRSYAEKYLVKCILEMFDLHLCIDGYNIKTDIV